MAAVVMSAHATKLTTGVVVEGTSEVKLPSPVYLKSSSIKLLCLAVKSGRSTNMSRGRRIRKVMREKTVTSVKRVNRL